MCMHVCERVCVRGYTAVLDCLRSDPLDLTEERLCEGLEAMEPCGGHDLSVAQSVGKSAVFRYFGCILCCSKHHLGHDTTVSNIAAFGWTTSR